MAEKSTPEQIAARKAAREAIKNDPKYAGLREAVRFTMEDVIEEMAEEEPPTENENPFDWLARKLGGK